MKLGKKKEKANNQNEDFLTQEAREEQKKAP